MPQVKFEPTIPVFERARAVHALDRTATMICFLKPICNNFTDYNVFLVTVN
jgi:hypothetical protein